MPESPLNNPFVREYLVSRLYERLSPQGTTQSELARRLGTSPAYISQIFSLKTNASLSILGSLASALGMAKGEFESLVREAKEASVMQNSTEENPADMLRRALLANGLDEDDEIPRILSYIDFQKHERARGASRE